MYLMVSIFIESIEIEYLSSFLELKIGVAYKRSNGEIMEYFPSDMSELENITVSDLIIFHLQYFLQIS